MPVIVRSLKNYTQTIDGQDIAPFAQQTRQVSAISPAVAAAAANHLVQAVMVPDAASVSNQPVNVTGIFAVGQTLTAVLGVGYSGGTVQWQRDGVDISGATGLTYVLTSTDLGHLVTAKVTGEAFVDTTDVSVVIAAGTTYARRLFMSGPSSGVAGQASANFVVSTDNPANGTVTVTPSDGGAGGTFVPSSLNLTVSTPSGSFKYTPASSGPKTISLTNTGGLTNPTPIVYTASTGAATSLSMTGPTSGTTGVASSDFTVAAVGGLSSNVVVTPSDGGAGGTFNPTTVTLTVGAPSATFKYTPSSVGSKTVSVTNGGGLTNPASLTYTSVAAAVNTKAKFGVGAANIDLATLFASMTDMTGSSNGTKTGSFSTATGAGQYGWVAILTSAATAGVTFTDSATGVSGWSGALLNTAAISNQLNDVDGIVTPVSRALSYTDANGSVWSLFRQDVVNSTPGTSYTIS